MRRALSDSDSEDDIWNYKSSKRRKNVKNVDITIKKTCTGHKRKQAQSANVTCSCKKTDNPTLIKQSKATDSTLGKDSPNPRISVIQETDEGLSKTSGSPLKVTCTLAVSCNTCTSPRTSSKSVSLIRQVNKNELANDQEPNKTPTSGRKSRKTLVKTPVERIKHEGNCPHCQMPFMALTIESPRWHTMECMDLPIIATQECPAGMGCDNTIPNHYRRFRHTLLAQVRSGCISEADTSYQNLDTPNRARKLDFGTGPEVFMNGTSMNDENNILPLSQHTGYGTSCINDNAADTLDQVTVKTEEGSAGVTKTIAVIEITPIKTESNDICPYFKDDNVKLEKILPPDMEEDGSRSCTPTSVQDIFAANWNSHTGSAENTDNSDPAEPGFTNNDMLDINWSDDDLSLTDDVDNGETTCKEETISQQQPVVEPPTCGPAAMPKMPGKTATKQMSISSFFKSSFNTLSKITDTGTSTLIPTLRRSGTSKAGMNDRFTGREEPSIATSEPQGFSYAGKRNCPFYKKMPGTPFTIDAFRYGNIEGCKAYFLTHFHYDHYGGLSKKFSGLLYCSPVTANLVRKKIRLSDRNIRTIQLNTPTNVMDVEVLFMDANHCPGAVIILFKLPNGKQYLHTGDFRADASIQTRSALVNVKLDELYLDTTYCDPQYAFPPQQDVVRFAVNVATDFMHVNPNAVIVVGSYTIGKERIFLAIAEALNCKICVTREKKSILECLEDQNTTKRLTLDSAAAKVHVIQMKGLNFHALTAYLEKMKGKFDKILGFEPTGWTHSKKKASSLDEIKPKIKSKTITVYGKNDFSLPNDSGVPYSEHSSFTELRDFVQFTRPKKVIPTVNVRNPATRKKMQGLFQTWLTSPVSANGSPEKQTKQSTINTFFCR